MTNLRILCGFGLLSLCVSARPLLAQSTCDLDARNRSTSALPSIAAAQMQAPLAAELRQGFDLVSVRNTPTQGQPYLRRALATATASQNTCAQAIAEYGLGQAARSLQLSEALPHFLRAQDLLATIGTPMSLANVHERVATTQWLTGQREAFLKNAPAIAQEFRQAGDIASAIRIQAMAQLYAEEGLKPTAQQALFDELATISTPNVQGVRGYVQWTWGSSMRLTGNYAQINAHFEAGSADLIACDCQPQTLAAILLNRAMAADSSSSGEAVLRFAQQADDVYRKSQLDSMRPQALRLMAAGYGHLQDSPRAIAAYQTALQLAHKQNAIFMFNNLHMELAAVYGDAGQPLLGLKTLDQISGKMSLSERCSYGTQKSALEDRAGLYAASLADGQKTLDECHDTLQADLLETIYRRMADAHIHQGHFDEAVALAKQAVVVVDKQRPRARKNDAALIAFNENQVQVYSVLIRALIMDGKPEEALLASEQSRARAFVDLTITAKPAEPATRASALPSESHPFTLTVEKMHSLLESQHATLVSYWLSEDRLYTWVMAPGQPVHETDQPMQPTQLAALVQATLPHNFAVTQRGGGVKVRTRGDLTQSIAPQTRKPWRDLYSILIAPIAAQLPPASGALLTIVPQGPLFQLSFAALLDPSGKYLVERYALNTTPSVGMLAVSERNQAQSAAMDAHYVVVANPAQLPKVNGAALPPLPGTELEAEGIARSLDPKQVTLLTGSHANLADLEQALPQATVVHLATHAVVSDQAPSTSFLALDARQSGGKLTMDAVYGLHLHARLVVLSACSTGRGKITGDGVSGLSRAFVYAGASSLVTTLWDVVDEPTAQLMPSFYAALASGKSESAALREAQLALIASLRKHRIKVETLSGTTLHLPENPSYWAAFSLSGQP